MAGHATFRSGTIKAHAAVRFFLDSCVAKIAWDLAVRPGQLIGGILVMVKKRWTPAFQSMAAAALDVLAKRGELPPVNILVTARAFSRRRPEHDIPDAAFKTGITVAACTHQTGMCAIQAKNRSGMVKSGQVLPGLHVMAGLTSGNRAIGTSDLHAFVKLPLVWVGMTSCARKIVIDKPGRFGRIPAGRTFMASHTRHSRMSAIQGKT
jgi:hypothetical protein